jgi:thiol:disulfide interchange protein
MVTCTAVWAALPRGSGEKEVQWVMFTPDAFDQARREHKPILVKFTAKWCANCVALEKTVYREPQVIDTLHNDHVIAMKLDVDKVGWDLLNKLAPGAGIPFTALYLPGQDQPITIASMHDTDALLKLLANVNSVHTVSSVQSSGERLATN